MAQPPLDGTHQAAEAAARQSYGKLIAFLAARTGDVAGAEDALSDAFAAALVDWPAHGTPASPEAWLLTVARRRMIDASRHHRQGEVAAAQLLILSDALVDAVDAAAGNTDIPDDRLRMMFACAHPAVDANVRAPLILQTTLGFDAAAIASAFLVSPATMSQRLVRAKNKIRQARIPFRVPERDGSTDLHERLAAVLDAIYAAYAEGWTDPTGTEARQRNLATESIWLGRLVAMLMPDEPEALGLLSLMLYAESRRHARRDAHGDYVPLNEQDPALWDTESIGEAERLLLRATQWTTEALGGATTLGRYQLEAAVQSAHCVRRITGRSDWAAIERLYHALWELTASPVVAINRAVAVAELQGAQSGLALLDALSSDVRLADYQPYWAARAALLARMGKSVAADQAYERAIGLERDPVVRRFLQRRRIEVEPGDRPEQGGRPI